MGIPARLSLPHLRAKYAVNFPIDKGQDLVPQ